LSHLPNSCASFWEESERFQRYRCDVCARTFTDETTRPADRRCLSQEKTILCLRMLLEGNSVRSTERLTEVNRNTIISMMVEVGNKCEPWMEKTVKGLIVNEVQADEIWGFVACKDRTRERLGYGDDKGDVWCFVGFDRDTKMVLAWHLDKRTTDAAANFSYKLRLATSGRFQLSTDGFNSYSRAVPAVFGNKIDYAQLVKTYGNTPENGTAARYSPGEVVSTHKVILLGDPQDDRICTSHSERQNLNIRMAIRRMTRLTNAHSKK
jgi:IS1 family transposase